MAGADRKHREALGRPVVAGGYRAEAPHQRAQACTLKPRVERRLKPETALWGLVMSYLKAGYSPEGRWHTGAREPGHPHLAGFS